MRSDLDWLVIGSGFGGSVSALRLAEKGYSVGVLECGRRFADDEFAKRTVNFGRYPWMPKLGMRGIMRYTPFNDIFVVSGCGVGGGSLGYASTLYRARHAFFAHPQWSSLGDWGEILGPHYDTAERMLGVTTYDREGPADALLRDYASELGVGDTFKPARVGVFLGEPGHTVADPYFDGEGPDRTGCVRCGACMVGCRYGAKNTLVKNYLWFAEKLGVEIEAERTVTDIRPRGAEDGSDGYVVTSERSGSWVRRDVRTHTARGVVVAAGALGTNKLLQNCRLNGSLPRISERLGELVRTNSESILAVTTPNDDRDFAHSIAITSSIYPEPDTHIEPVTYGRAGDSVSLLFTLMTGRGTRLTRPLLWMGTALRHPIWFLRTLSTFKWSRRTVILLVMQTLDNAIRLRPRRFRLGRRVYLTTEQDSERPNPTFIPAANAAAKWIAKRTAGFPQAGLTESFMNIPTTAHILGGAVIAEGPESGVVDEAHRVFGYERLMVCDGAAVPANPGVNPSLTITALAEQAMSRISAKEGCAEPADDRVTVGPSAGASSS